MSRIQELLAKQRGQQNVTVEKSVLQSGPEKTTEPKEPPQNSSNEKIDGKRQSLFAKLGRKPASNSTAPVVEQGALENGQLAETIIQSKAAETNRQTSETGNKEEKSVIILKEEIMPAGLSLLAQMKWKREHVSHTKSHTATDSIHKKDIVGEKSQQISSIEDTNVSQQVQELSASQSADASKTNDGFANIEELRRNLAYLANNIENKEIVGQVVRTIASQLKNSPELCPGMTNADVNLVVRGARMAYQVAAMRKQEKADIKKSKSKDTEVLDAFFKDAGINFNM